MVYEENIRTSCGERELMCCLSFYINLPIGGFAAIIISITFYTPSVQKSHPDRHASTGALQCLLLALYWGGVLKPWAHTDVIGTLVGFGVLTLTFVAVEYRQGPYAMLVNDLLKKREVWVGGVFSFFLSGSLFVLVYFLPIYFQAIQGCSAVESGIRSLALVIPVCTQIPQS
jgi:hypothetical protein